MQHWRFIAVRRPEDKAILAEAAYGQRQVVDAAVTFILLGDLNSVEHLGETLEHAVKSGSLARARAEAWVAQAEKIYTDPQMSRDEAIRSCSLAAMTMMLAAEARGLGIGALVGFDPDRVMREFKINERYLPVMLLAVGHPLKKDERRKDRLPLGQILCFDRGESLPD
jgi:nitroreductase